MNIYVIHPIPSSPKRKLLRKERNIFSSPFQRSFLLEASASPAYPSSIKHIVHLQEAHSDN